jgi:ribose transport system substrate-binding protein
MRHTNLLLTPVVILTLALLPSCGGSKTEEEASGEAAAEGTRESEGSATGDAAASGRGEVERGAGDDVVALARLAREVEFPELDAGGGPTGRVHAFEEAPLDLPESVSRGGLARGFVVVPESGSRGLVEAYRLRQAGTGATFTVRYVPVAKGPLGRWAIAAEGWRKVREGLQGAMGVALGEPSAAARAAAKPVVAVIPRGEAHPYWQAAVRGARDAAKAAGLEVIVRSAQPWEVAEQVAIVDEMVERGVDGIVLAPSDPKALVKAVEEAHRAGIPVVAFDVPVDTEKVVSFVGADNAKAGALAANRLAETLGGKGSVALLRFVAGATALEARAQGMLGVLEKFPEIKVVADQHTQGSPESALRVMQNLLEAHPDVAGVLTVAEPVTVGAVAAIRERGLDERVKLVGFDASRDLVERVRAGSVDALLVQDPVGIGTVAVRVLVDHLNGAAVPKRVEVGTVLVTKETLESEAVKKVLGAFGVEP